MLKDSIHTLSVSRCELKKISELFNVNIKCFDITYDEKYKDGKVVKFIITVTDYMRKLKGKLI